MESPSPMRLIYLGRVPGWQTQAVYHAIADLMTPESLDTIIICQPVMPYVCLGYHQVLDQVFDREVCEEKNIPVYRRKIGGGGTYLDKNQLFYQCVFRSAQFNGNFREVYRKMLTPPVMTLQDLGLDARLREVNEVEVNGKRIAGTGGGQIGEAAVVVGNFLFDFDEETVASLWAVPNEVVRRLALNGLKESILTLDQLGITTDMQEVVEKLLKNYEKFLERPVQFDSLTKEEIERAGEFKYLMESDDFLKLHSHRKSEIRSLKISARTYIHWETASYAGEDVTVGYRVEDGIIREACIVTAYGISYDEPAKRFEDVPYEDRQSLLTPLEASVTP